MAVSRFSNSTIANGFPKSKNLWDGVAYIPATYTYSATQPVAWYRASDIASTFGAGDVWKNQGSGVGTDMVCTGGGTNSTWRNGLPATNGGSWSTGPINTSYLDQNGNMTWIMVAQHNGAQFSPYAGVGEWWGNYSPAINSWYYHGLYGSWGSNSSSPSAIGGKKASGSYTFRVFQNGNFSQDTPGPYSSPNTIYLQPGGASNQYIAEMLVWNQNLSDSEVTTVTNALRSKYAF
jgi:hypothetical protein